MQNRLTQNERCILGIDADFIKNLVQLKHEDNPAVRLRGHVREGILGTPRPGVRGPVMCHSWVQLTQTYKATISAQPGGPEQTADGHDETARL